ncbi:MAG: hypothetical protein CL942_06715 [Desulfovibrio sp.]|nr:hypothetical protein [Desulfovibrio sp.]|tara:strand:- start:24243 stop:25739 length:1497 start_codon:yes stop_codon:yes gene_type:complete
MNLALLSIPLAATKKESDRALPFSIALNYGLLSIATYVSQHGFKAEVFDPQPLPRAEAVDRALEWLLNAKPHVIALSCISGFSYKKLKEYSARIREQFPITPIVVGGQDHVGRLGESVFDDIPEIDVVVHGEAEKTTLAILRYSIAQKDLEPLCREYPIWVKNRDNKVSTFSSCSEYNVEEIGGLDYSLYCNAKAFPASIEVARGCPFNCKFCSNIKRKYIKKSPEDIVGEAKEIVKFYERDDISIYFQSPIFLMEKEEIELLKDERNREGLCFKWRAQTRVDTLSPDDIPLLVEAGAAVIDLGFESGAPEMLLAMRKTKTPESYLNDAKQILLAAHQAGLIIKLNILFYAGERRATLLETFDFLSKNERYLHSISAYPLLVCPGTQLEESIEPILLEHGGSVCTSPEWAERHIFPVNSSAAYSYDRLKYLGKMFGKAFQTVDNYYQERRHGYYRPGLTKSEFDAQLNSGVIELLPCSIDKKNMLEHRRRLHQTIIEG